MRWNPRHPGNHQYATDALGTSSSDNYKNLYDKIGIKGVYFIRDINRDKADSSYP